MIATINKIVSGINSNSYIGMFDVGGPHPKQGEFLIRGTPFASNLIQRLGYVTQIRIGKGQFKSDMYFLRLADGSLITCENDCYIPMTGEQEAMARDIFKTLPEDEGFDSNPEYRDCNGVGERGFLVHNSETVPSPDTPFTITIAAR